MGVNLSRTAQRCVHGNLHLPLLRLADGGGCDPPLCQERGRLG